MARREGGAWLPGGHRRLRRLGGSDPPSGTPPVVEVAAVLDLLEVAFAAGMSVPGALDAVGRAMGGPRGRVMSGVAAAVTLGAGWDEAWCAPGGGPTAAAPWAGSRAPGGLGPVADALRATWEDGAPPRAAVRAAAATLRRERHARALEAAARLGVRLVLPLGLCYLPAFVLVGLVPVVVSMAAGVLAP